MIDLLQSSATWAYCGHTTGIYRQVVPVSGGQPWTFKMVTILVVYEGSEPFQFTTIEPEFWYSGTWIVAQSLRQTTYDPKWRFR
jgi:hypothetical protein